MRIIGSTSLVLLMLCVMGAAPAWAQHPVPQASGIWQGAAPYALHESARAALVESLRRITGIAQIAFTTDGRLAIGDGPRVGGRSRIAERILREAIASGDTFVLEDHSGSDAVNFGQIEAMDYFNDATHRHARVWWIRMDFEDFTRMSASPRVRTAFDEGFTLLHELLHALGHRDAANAAELGECETILNEARREVGLPVRAEYFATRTRQLGESTIRLRFNDGPSGHRLEFSQDLVFAMSRVARPASTASAGFRLP